MKTSVPCFVKRKILIIEDDESLADLARIHLEDHGYQVEVVHDGDSGLDRVESREFDLILLDLMLPGADGLEICKRIRSRPSYTPTLILTARSTEMDRVLGLELGADDYLVKPVSLRELVARVKAIFRRVDALAMDGSTATAVIRIGRLHIDGSGRRVLMDGKPVSLTAREFDLLVHFATHPGRVFSRRQLLDSVWGLGYEGYEHTVNSHINRLRSKIERDPSNPEWIITVWSVGYKFRALEE